MKVYGWTGSRAGVGQTREIMAAKSWAEVARASGQKLHYLRAYGSTTGNAREIAVAITRPGVVFWQPLDARNGEFRSE